jgi:FkbM family methyltransferase
MWDTNKRNRLCASFGPLGLKLFDQFQFGNLEKVVLPAIKHPFTLRYDTSDIPVFDQVFLNEEYNIKLTTPQVVIDGGANIGLFALYIKNKYPEAKIICIEPDLENFKVLQKNTSLYDNIFCENYGLWNKDAKLRVYDKYDMGKWAMVVEEDSMNGNISAVSLKVVMEKYSIDRIDVLKLDIETSEKQLFFDNYDYWLPKTKIIIIELHDWMEDGCSKPFFEAINKTFSKYKFSMIGENVVIENKDLN